MRPRGRNVEQEIARLATSQHGVVTRAELRDAGLSDAAIQRRVQKRWLLPQYRGVYRLGHEAPSVRARYLAAVRACGTGAFLSGRAAGYLLGLVKGKEPPPEVTTPTERRISGITTRRARGRGGPCAMLLYGIPVTTVADTIVDLARVLTEERLARACHEAGILHGATPALVESALARRPNAAGAGRLRAVLRGDVHVTLSKLERAFLELLEQHGLVLPRTNRPAGKRRVDCRWPEQKLTVELDGYRYHHSRHAWEQDRRREREARARGDEFRRYTYGDVLEKPALMLRELEGLVPRRPPGVRPSA